MGKEQLTTMRRLSFRPDGRERTRVLGGYLLWKELVSSDPEVSSARAALIEGSMKFSCTNFQLAATSNSSAPAWAIAPMR